MLGDPRFDDLERPLDVLEAGRYHRRQEARGPVPQTHLPHLVQCLRADVLVELGAAASVHLQVDHPATQHVAPVLDLPFRPFPRADRSNSPVLDHHHRVLPQTRAVEDVLCRDQALVDRALWVAGPLVNRRLDFHSI